MIKKNVKKIPKYNSGGTISPDVLNKAMEGKFNPPTTVGLSEDNSVAAGGSGFGGQGGQIGAAAIAGGKMLMNAFGVEDNSQLGVTLNTSMQGAEIGGAIVPGWGHLAGGLIGGLMGATKGGSVDKNTGEIQYGGIWGHSKGYLRRKSNMIKNSIQSKQNTQNLQADYYDNPNVIQNANVLAAEGAVIRRPVDALVSKGELIYDPETKQLSKVPGSKGKPNKKDDVAVKLYEGDVVVSNSPTMMMSNGKTPAQNLERMVTIDKKKSNKLSEGTTKAREAIIKKVVNWQEANKTKPQEYAMYAEGDDNIVEKAIEKSKQRGKIVAQTQVDGKTYVKLGDGHWYDTINGEVGKRAILTSKLRKAFANVEETPVVESTNVQLTPGGYNQKWEWQSGHAKNPIYQQLFGQNKKYNLAQPLKQVELSGYNYGPSYGEYNPDFGNYDYSDLLHIPENWKPSSITSRSASSKVDTTTNTQPSQEEKATPEQITEFLRNKDIGKRHWLNGSVHEPKQSLASLAKVNPEQLKSQKLAKPKQDSNNRQDGSQGTPKWLNTISDIVPLMTALFGDYDYHREQAYINPAKYIPTGINIDPIRRVTDESYAMARYNQANISPNTGAGMAYGLQAASNRAKQLADSYKWQQEQQNKLIAQNVGIYNDWAAREAQARHIANTETGQNEAAADYIRKTDIKSGLDWYQGRKRDRQMLPALKQYLSSGMYRSTLDNLNV